MRIVRLVVLAALSCLASPAFACQILAKYPEHLWGSAVGWWQPYRVVEVVEAHDDHFVVTVKRDFGNKTDVGKRTTLQFIANEEAHAICPVSLEVGKTYLVQTMTSTEPLQISRFNWLNMPTTDPKYDGYVQDLEKSEVRPMYVEANSVIFDTQNNRVILRGKVELSYNNFHLFAEQVIDDHGVNELVAEGDVLLLNPDRSITRIDRLRLSDDDRDTFRSILIEPRTAPWR